MQGYFTCSLASRALTADIKLSPHAESPEISSASSLFCLQIKKSVEVSHLQPQS